MRNVFSSWLTSCRQSSVWTKVRFRYTHQYCIHATFCPIRCVQKFTAQNPMFFFLFMSESFVCCSGVITTLTENCTSVRLVPTKLLIITAWWTPTLASTHIYVTARWPERRHFTCYGILIGYVFKSLTMI